MLVHDYDLYGCCAPVVVGELWMVLDDEEGG